MHTKRVSLWREIHSAAVSSLSFYSPLLFVMSGAKKVARAFNSWSKEGLDMLGGADGAALEELLSEFMAEPGFEAHTPNSKAFLSMNIHYLGTLIGEEYDEDFSGHFIGVEEGGSGDPSAADGQGMEGDSVADEDFIPPLFEPEDDLWEPQATAQDSSPSAVFPLPSPQPSSSSHISVASSQPSSSSSQYSAPSLPST
jgi:hypothetical protein